jgi:hypothetical protein
MFTMTQALTRIFWPSAFASIFSFLPRSAVAQCMTEIWLGVWPAENTQAIQSRQVFMFSGGYTGGPNSLEKMVPQFGKTIRAYLWSAHDSVELRVMEQLSVNTEQEFDAYAQVLLQPSRPLLPDSVYELHAWRDNENMFYLFRNGRPVPGKTRTTAYRWKVSAVADTQAPVWTATPSVQKSKYESNSEGVENYVLFSNPVRDSSSYLIKATVWHVNSKESATKYLLPWQNQLPIGWFTCGGSVRFKSQEAYTVRFEAIDAAGNRAVVSGRPIPFQAPKKVACCW